MISVKEAETLVTENVTPFNAADLALAQAHGRVLREDVFADRDHPAYPRSTMDGIAINCSALKKEERTFVIEGIQKAGIPAIHLQNPRGCLEIMTGGLLPTGCDAVIPVEDVEIRDHQAIVKSGTEVKTMQYVHAQAADYKAGEVLLHAGAVLTPPQIAIAAAVGKARLKVTAVPNIAVIGSGDELVDIDQPVEPHQVRRSNAYAVAAALNLHGFPNIQRLHMHDDKNEIRDILSAALGQFDLLILSGGVSMGKFDFLPQVLRELNLRVIFHKVKQRPGKPLLFGKSPTGVPVFALPGNPVSTQICTYRYVLPYLKKAAGIAVEEESPAVLTEGYDPANSFTNFLPVSITGHENGKIQVRPAPFQVSGNFAALAQTQGFIQLPAENKPFPEGTEARFFPW